MTTYAAALLDKARLTCSPANYNALALRMGVSRQAVSRWRNGIEPLPEERVRELARVAHVDEAAWWLAVQSDKAPEGMKPQLRTLLHRAGIAALLALFTLPALASISQNPASTAYYVNLARRMLDRLLTILYRRTRKRHRAYLLAMPG